MVMLSIAPINEIKLVAVVVLLAAALLTGPVTGLALGWRHGRLGKLAGLALGLSVGVLGLMVVVAEMVLTGPEEFAYSVAPAPEASGGEVLIKGAHHGGFGLGGAPAPEASHGEVRYMIPAEGPLHGRVTLTSALLYPVRVGAAMVCAWFVTTRLWTLGRMVARFVVRSR